MPTKSKNLFTYLLDLEVELSGFSFEELSSDEASELKETFQTFKNDLEKKFFGKETVTNGNAKKEANIDEIMLIAKMGHEIRTPLDSIVEYTDFLKESDLTTVQTTHVNAIRFASRTLAHIIDEFLEYSKLSAGINDFESIDFDFHKLVNDVAYLCKTLILEKNVELEVRMDSAIPKILVGDPSKLSQVLLNLIGNAIEFVEKGSVQLEIVQVGLDSKEILLEFNVMGMGIGISENNLEHIQDPFKEEEPNTCSKYGNTRLDLNISEQIIKSLNGEISVNNRLGKESSFIFTLPYKKKKDRDILRKV